MLEAETKLETVINHVEIFDFNDLSVLFMVVPWSKNEVCLTFRNRFFGEAFRKEELGVQLEAWSMKSRIFGLSKDFFE